MALTKFEKDMQIIQALDDEPNDVGGMTAAELKAKYDEGGEAIKQYINETLTQEVASREELQGLVLGQIPDGTITTEKLSEDVSSIINAHAARHAIGGSDPLTPAQIGAASLNQVALNENDDWRSISYFITPGSFVWTAPDFFKGNAYFIGVILVGGGASGVSMSNPLSGGDVMVNASGGQSGHCFPFVEQVSPGVKYNLVVGTGGPGYEIPKQTGSGNATGQNPGGSTAMLGRVALGGYAIAGSSLSRPGRYQPSAIGVSGAWQTDPAIALEGGIPTVASGNIVSPCATCFNPFSKAFVCSAGQGVAASWKQTGVITQLASSGMGSNGGACAFGNQVNATASPGSYGGGGGAAMSFGSVAKSGNGGDGYVVIYAKGVSR